MTRESKADGLNVEKGMITMSVKTLWKVVVGVVVITAAVLAAWYTLATKAEMEEHEALPLHPAGVQAFTEVETKVDSTITRVEKVEDEAKKDRKVLHGLSAKIDFLVVKTVEEDAINKVRATKAQKAAGKRARERFKRRQELVDDPLEGL